jgi:hypothetical protein
MFCAPGVVLRWYRGHPIPFSCLALSDMFLAVLRASGPIFMFCASGIVFGGAECVVSRIHVLRSRTRFRRYRGRQVPYSSFARLKSFSVVSRTLGPIFMFCAPELIFGGIEGVGSRFHVLRSQTHFRRYRGRRIPFSYFARLDSFSAVLRASGPFFMFCAPGLVFGGTEGVGSRFHLLRSQYRYRRYRGRRVTFSCFARPDTFVAVSRASGPIFTFCALGLIFGGTEGVRSRFHVLCSRTRFRRCRVRRNAYSCFARPDSFLTIPRASGPVFMFCVPGLVFDRIEGVGFRFHVLRARTHFRRY